MLEQPFLVFIHVRDSKLPNLPISILFFNFIKKFVKKIKCFLILFYYFDRRSYYRIPEFYYNSVYTMADNNVADFLKA